MSLKTKLEKSLNEKDVENIYRSELDKIEESSITSPYGVDGLLETKNIRSLLEFKKNWFKKNIHYVYYSLAVLGIIYTFIKWVYPYLIN